MRRVDASILVAVYLIFSRQVRRVSAVSFIPLIDILGLDVNILKKRSFEGLRPISYYYLYRRVIRALYAKRK